MLELIGQLLGPAGTVLVIAALIIITGIKILKEYERAVIFRLGRMVAPRGPGIIYVIPLVEKMLRVDLRTVTMEVPPQDVITRDNVSVKVSAVLYFRVIDPNRAIREVEHYLFATSQLAQVTLRSVCGQAQLDELLAEREKINSRIQGIIDSQTDPWGIKVVLVEVKHIDLPQEMQRAMAKQAEAERERRAKLIHADGEFQASQKLADAAAVIAKQPTAMHLRFLQSLVQVGAENNHTVVVPIPVDLVTSLFNRTGKKPNPNWPTGAVLKDGTGVKCSSFLADSQNTEIPRARHTRKRGHEVCRREYRRLDRQARRPERRRDPFDGRAASGPSGGESWKSSSAETDFADADYFGVSGHLGHISEVAAIQRALREVKSDFDAVVSLGGESFLVYMVAGRQNQQRSVAQ